MEMRGDDSVYLKTFTIFAGTWNVYGQSPKESLKDWLAVDPVPPDFLVVGFQEIDHNKEAYSPKEEEWLTAITAGLNPIAKYTMVKFIRLFGVMLIVFTKEELAGDVKNVAAEIGDNGNKKGVAIRLDFHQTSICFVNCHLTPHTEGCERRNEDYNDICAHISFNQFSPSKHIKDHDQIYWIGDMNYRIINLDIEEIKGLIDNKHYSILMENDQLLIQKGLKKVFAGFNEGVIDFIPTFKYNLGTNNWDSVKNRSPAWCDRVLWRGENVTQIYYRSHPMFLYSDHKPVSALFDSQIKVIDVVK